MTLREIRKFAAETAEVLGLGDWNLLIQWATKAHQESEECPEDCEATISWQIEHKVARILLNKKDLPEDPRRTLVHEILHLRLESGRNEPFKYQAYYELGINVLADLLLPVIEFHINEESSSQ